MPSEREYEQALQREPGHNEAFLFLRRSYRESGRFDKLVTLYETRAQAITDQTKAAELFYLAAEVRIDHLSDVSGAEADLAHAVSRDATHRKAVKRLKDIYREQGRSDEYLKMLEVEAAALGQTQGSCARCRAARRGRTGLRPTHRAHRARPIDARPARRGHRRAAQDRSRPHARFTTRSATIPMVCRLFEIELAGTTDPKRRIALMFRLGRVLAEKIGDLPARGAEALRRGSAVSAGRQGAGSIGFGLRQSQLDRGRRSRSRGGPVQPDCATTPRGRRHRQRRCGVAQGPDGSAIPRRGTGSARTRADRIQSLRRPRSFPARARDACAHDAREDRHPDQARSPGRNLAGRRRRRPSVPTSRYSRWKSPGDRRPTGWPSSTSDGMTTPSSPSCAKSSSSARATRKTGWRCCASWPRSTTTGWATRSRPRSICTPFCRTTPATRQALKAYADHFRQRGSFRELADLLEFAAEHDLKQGQPVEELLPRLEEVAAWRKASLATSSALSRCGAASGNWRPATSARARRRSASCRRPSNGTRWFRCWSTRPSGAELAEVKIDVLHRLARLHAEKLEQRRQRHRGLPADPRHRSARAGGLAQRRRDLREDTSAGPQLAPLLAQPDRERRGRGRKGQHSCAACSSSTWKSSVICRRPRWPRRRS